jgi:hypothetical protein
MEGVHALFLAVGCQLGTRGKCWMVVPGVCVLSGLCVGVMCVWCAALDLWLHTILFGCTQYCGWCFKELAQ